MNFETAPRLFSFLLILATVSQGENFNFGKPTKWLCINFTKSDDIILFRHREIKKVFVGMKETFEKRSLVGLKRSLKK